VRNLDDQEQNLAKKFRTLATPLVGEQPTEAMISAIVGLESQAHMSERLG